MLLNQHQIKQIIPHRDPFLLVDEVSEMVTGQSIKAIKKVTGNEFWVPGHFPNRPIMPGVLIIEALAQAGAICILSTPEFKGKIALFAGLESARFRRPVVPGDTLQLHVTITKIRGPFGFGDFIAKVNGEIVCEASGSFAIN